MVDNINVLILYITTLYYKIVNFQLFKSLISIGTQDSS